MKLYELFPGDFEGSKQPKKSILDSVADYLNGEKIKNEISKSQTGLQGYVRFKIRNGKLINRYDTYQVEIDHDTGFTSWSIVKRDPAKVIYSGKFKSTESSQKILDAVIEHLKMLLK